MSNLSLEKLGDNLPASGLTGISQAAVGFGAGLLLAGYINSKVRDKLAIGLVTAGAVAFLPVVAGVVKRFTYNPNSQRRVQKKLDALRGLDGAVEDESQLV